VIGSTAPAESLPAVAPELSPASSRAAAVRFAERHPTSDLLDLGSDWLLLRMEIAEAMVRTERSCILIDTRESVGLLACDPYQ
jgi:hypothetical protein